MPAFGRSGLAIFVASPAGDRAVGLHPAGVAPSGTDMGECPLGRSGLAQGVTELVLVTSPAGDRTVDPHSAGVSQARADGGELSTRRLGLRILIGSPAGDGADGRETAVVPLAGAELGE